MNMAVLKTANSPNPRFSFRDSTILAAALALGCDRVYTEDLRHGRVVEGRAVIDPFR
jgi:predicted nucleic acid-binding protein